MFGAGAADVVVTSLDRVVLGARSALPPTLGLYEGAIRPNNVVRSVTGAFSVTLLPVLSRLEQHRGRRPPAERWCCGAPATCSRPSCHPRRP